MNLMHKRSLSLFTALLVLFTMLSFPSITKAAEVTTPGRIIPNVVIVGVGEPSPPLLLPESCFRRMARQRYPLMILSKDYSPSYPK